MSTRIRAQSYDAYLHSRILYSYAPKILFEDDFESGNLNLWTGATSSYAAVGGTAAHTGIYGCDRTLIDGSWEFLIGSGDIQNGVWEMWIKQGVVDSYPGIRTRYLDSSNYIDFGIVAATNQIAINDVGGTGNHLGSVGNSAGTWYFMQATLNGTAATLKIYNTSMTLMQTLNATVTDRKAAYGFKCYRDSQFDNYKVSSI